MTEQPDSSPSERLGRPPRFVILILAAVVLATAGWSAVWYIGTRKADTLMTEWLAAEAARGRRYDCADRAIGGYPFRVEVTCQSPVLEIADAAPAVRVRAGKLHAVAQVWNVSHVIFEIDGPIRIEAGDRETTPDFYAVDAGWKLLQGSLRAPAGLISRIDLSISDFTATPDPDTVGPGGGVTVTARRLGLHGRNADAPAGTGRDYDLAVDAEELVVGFGDRPTTEAVDVSFVGRLDAMPNPPPREPEAFLAAWRDNGGSVTVERLSATQGDSEVRAAGRVTPDSTGRPEGIVTLSLAGPDIRVPGSAGAFGGLAPIVALALKLTGEPAEIDGRTALSGELEIRDGTVYLGAVPITELPRLF